MKIYNRINKRKRLVSSGLLLAFFFEIVPMNVFSLTGGPSQPEVQSFQPIGVSDMVDPFTGDFSYNLPLLDIDGYPINLVYNSGIGTDAESSWVGLGWNINPGVINRSMRGLPDDFNGDLITKELNMRPNKTIGVTGSTGAELFGIKLEKGKESLSFGLGISYNNYNGFGMEQTVNASLSAGDKSKGKLNAGLGLTSSSENGLTISPTLSYEKKIDDSQNQDRYLGLGVGTSFNSRSGLGALTIDAKAEVDKVKATNNITKDKIEKKGGFAGFNSRMSGDVLSGGLGSSISFGTNDYSPSGENPMLNMNLSFSTKLGVTFNGTDGTLNLRGYYSVQKLKSKTVSNSAYGYLNLQNAPLDGDVNNSLLDFNREKESSFNVNTSNLPLTNYTYDIMSVSGHGIGGSFRPFRNEIGAVADPLNRNTSAGGSLGGEAGGGNLLKIGLDVHVNYTNTQNNIWDDQNLTRSKIKFNKSISNAEGAYEPSFFKQTGEMSVDDESEFSDKFLKGEPIQIALEKAGRNVYAKGEFLDKNGTSHAISDEMYRTKRVKRGQAMTYLTRGELSKYALSDYSDLMYNAPDHHIAEVSVVRTDGARYYYGIPAYNYFQEQTTFALGSGGNSFDIQNKYTPVDMREDEKGLIRYYKGENSINNAKGLNHYYNSEKTPAYAHSYLLTAIVSPEYTDVDGVRGPSKGDIGNYTLFEYKKLARPYKWRVPFENLRANYNEGMKSNNTDDMGNYQYGEKEIWYLDKIVTKNTIAVFTTEYRNDGYGVNDRDGGFGKGSIGMHLLRKISLYSRPDFESDPNNAIPIKEVHFEYDYSLCKGIPNNKINRTTPGAQGKLTLKSLYFTYGKSYRAKFSPYTFTYSDFNPNYNLKAYDRWGNYKPNTNGSYLFNGPMHAAEYPYVEQNKTTADLYSSAWSLSEIQLPSGGKIKVTYESDDYAYVQNKKAMQMFKVNSIGTSSENVDDENPNYQSLSDFLDPSNNKLMGNHIINKNHLFLTFKLQEEIPSSMSSADARQYLFDNYLKGIDNLYFRVLGNLTNNDAILTAKNQYEYVSGYAEIDDYDVRSYNPISGGNYNYFFVKLKSVTLNENGSPISVNPISKAIWQFGRTNCPRTIYDQPTIEEPGDNVLQFLKAVNNSNMIKNLIETFQGPNYSLLKKNYGKDIINSKSFVRFNNPTGFKFGGGCRVKKIEISDEWSSMVPGNPTYEYGQEYDYTIYDEAQGKVISSGVASYEPQIGGDENPWRQPVFAGDKDEKLLAPDDKSYTETPFGESLFPSPSVGYSKVTIKNLQYSGVTRHATGKVVNEFYTAKDFPTIVDYTKLDYKGFKTKRIWNILSKSSVDYMTASQGYVVEMNDMHGKPKANWVYAEDANNPISGMEYKYKCKPYGNGNYRLVNDATILNKDGSSSTKEIGVEYDMYVDFREQSTKTYGGGTDVNTAGFLAALFPVAVPAVLPEYSVEKTRFRSAVITKVVSRYGIVDETIAYDLGSSVPTKNLAYDSESGQVLLTMTKNEFEDDIYSFQYPAHWFYEEMGAAYKNIGATFSNITLNASGKFTHSNASDFFFIGDEIATDDEKAWVTEVIGNEVTLVNFLGLPFKPSETVSNMRIVRSGRRNIISANIGSVVSTVNPLNSLEYNNISGVLTASAQVFKEGWKTYCECFTEQNEVVYMSKNPYINGQKGIYRPYRAYAFLTDRTHTLKNSNTNIRKDGQYTTFTPFWNVNNGKWSIDETNWQWTTEITEYGPYGEELENMDALFRFSSAIYGYNNSLPTAVAANAKRKSIGFDAFEDYGFVKCSNDHFSYKTAPGLMLDYDAHTGKMSIKLDPGNMLELVKPVGEACE
jgi:hypothetical protein